MLSVLIIAIVGLLIGSFANVVIHRLPRGASIVYPGSACPDCKHPIRPWHNVPVLSWLVLRGRCWHCQAPISGRYPLVELLVAGGFVLLALRWPVEVYGVSVLPLLAVFAALVMMSVIDIDHYLLPDSLTLPALVVAVLGAFVYHPATGLPGTGDAVFAAGLGAGIIVLVNRIGSLVLRRLADTKERLWPVGMDQVNIAAVAGAFAGWLAGLIAAGASILANLVAGWPLRISEPVIYGAWLAALVIGIVAPWIDPVGAISGSLVAAGGVAVLGALYWWITELAGSGPAETSQAADDDEPIAMGFGDVKLAAVLGAVLGWENLLVALFLSFIFGAAGGLTVRLLGGSRQVPFGPYLVLGGLVALFYGGVLIEWYLGQLGL